jgi:hypothetical protein
VPSADWFSPAFDTNASIPFRLGHSCATVLLMPELGKFLVVIGAVVILLGLLLWSGFGSWMGRLPGDIRIEGRNSAFYFPIVTCIIISIVLSVIFSFFRR